MAASEHEVHGPIDFVLIEFPSEGLTGAAGDALLELVDRGIVRVYDLLVVRKDDDGTVSGIDVTDLSASGLGGFTAFEGARSGLLGDDDVAEAAAALEPGTTAAMILYENTWAIPLVAAALDAGAQLVASQRIPATAVMEALDELEAADGAN
jgi:hypothetical protein